MAGPAADWGTIVLHVDGAITTAEVRARIDGQRVDLTLPATTVPVAPGRHEVEVEGLQGFVTTFGETRATVDVPPRQHVDLHYALPRTTLSAGRLGEQPQQRSWGPDWRHIGIVVGGVLLVLLLGIAAVVAWQVLGAG
ncbi:MAG: hypothetical protein GX555_02790 [Actinomycetales bacterium]|nr:hypothetical protein [Actinomycetales bacterium]